MVGSGTGGSVSGDTAGNTASGNTAVNPIIDTATAEQLGVPNDVQRSFARSLGCQPSCTAHVPSGRCVCFDRRLQAESWRDVVRNFPDVTHANALDAEPKHGPPYASLDGKCTSEECSACVRQVCVRVHPPLNHLVQVIGILKDSGAISLAAVPTLAALFGVSITSNTVSDDQHCPRLTQHRNATTQSVAEQNKNKGLVKLTNTCLANVARQGSGVRNNSVNSRQTNVKMRDVNPFEQHNGERARAPRAAVEDIIGRVDEYYSYINHVCDTQAHASRCIVLTKVNCLPTAGKRIRCHCVQAVGRCAYCPTSTSRATSTNSPAVKKI